jgi:hypothetical protein
MFAPDFFNNLAAVSTVLLFAKVFTHRSRKPARPTVQGGSADSKDHERVSLVVIVARYVAREAQAVAHVACVVSAGVSLTVALVAVERESDWTGLHMAGWIALVIAGLILIVDLLVEDLRNR